MPDQPRGTAFDRYLAFKFEAVRLIQTALHLCLDSNDTEGQRLYRSLLARIAEDRFNLAVVGPFNRGKSTLLNALLGMERLPTSVVPHTSVVTTVTYGSPEKVLIRCDDWSIPQEIPLRQLADYITEKGNPGNRLHVKLAEIRLAAETLRQGFNLIDTPGLGSAFDADSSATRQFIPEIDAAIFVSSFETPLGGDDLCFLKQIHLAIGKVFVVMNKLDLAGDDHRREIMAFVRRLLDAELGVDNYELFALSAKRGLCARLAHNDPELAGSGLPALERRLTQFILHEKKYQFSRRIADRLKHLLRRQQVELSISRAGGTDNDTGAEELRKAFKKQVTALKARNTATAIFLKRRMKMVAQELSSQLDILFTEIVNHNRKTFVPRLLSRKLLFPSADYSATIKKLTDSCRRAVDTWITSNLTLTIQPTIENLGDAFLKDLRQSPGTLLRLAIQQSEPSESSWRDERDLVVDYNLVFAEAPSLMLNHLPPWWLSLLPLHIRENAIQRWFSGSFGESLVAYRQDLEMLLATGATKSIDNLIDDVARRIDEVAGRIDRYIGSELYAKQAEIVDDLLRRTDILDAQLREIASQKNRAVPLIGRDNLAGSKADTALGEEQCPICIHGAEILFAFLSKYQFAIGVTEESGKMHAEIGGFCSTHTWMYAEMTSPQGICSSYPELLTAVSDELTHRLNTCCGTEDLEATVHIILRRSKNCPVCNVLEREAREMAHGFAKGTFDTAAPPILCLTHLLTMLEERPSDEIARKLTERTAKGMKRSAENMRQQTLKHDAIRRDLMTHEERIAHLVGLSRVASDKRLVPQWSKGEL